MSEVHIFQCSGDSCPVCVALNGAEVPPGFQPHDGCACNTVPKDEDAHCEWAFEQTGNLRDGSGDFDVITGFEVTVICPDGSTVGASGSFDGHPYNSHGDTDLDDWARDLSDEAEGIAQDLCDSCPEKPPFLCC
jgi:hypothetical protein